MIVMKVRQHNMRDFLWAYSHIPEIFEQATPAHTETLFQLLRFFGPDTCIDKDARLTVLNN
jgi:hypothetical protein|tara:strand:- start:460 stop:642 length:183 start_codon:yes stop_codon:yes gene_type:complete